jgi:hypothetical protein
MTFGMTTAVATSTIGQPESFPLTRYDAMCHAIDAAHEVDEVKDIRDQALAFEVYSRQARNIDAERRACEVRLRAERKCGELDKVREKARGGQPYQATGSTAEPVERTPTLADLGISKRQAHDWRRLADVPVEQFEQALADPTVRPTTAGIIAQAATEKHPERVPVSAEALWLWGRLRDFDRDGMLATEPGDVLLTMTPEMLDDVHRLAPRVAAWLRLIGD